MDRLRLRIPPPPPPGPFRLPPWRPAKNRTRRKLVADRRYYNVGRRWLQRFVRHAQKNRSVWDTHPFDDTHLVYLVAEAITQTKRKR